MSAQANDTMRSALLAIAHGHVPDQPAASGADETTWIMQHVSRLRIIARNTLDSLDAAKISDGPGHLANRLEDTNGVNAREPVTAHAAVSIAVSLKRIADCLEAPDPKHSANINCLLWEISQRLGEAVNR